jgi:hypothetical protein
MAASRDLTAQRAKKAEAERAELEAELDELDSYNGHLAWMDKHYPLDVPYFSEGEDVGCQVMRLSRKVMEQQAAHAACSEKLRVSNAICIAEKRRTKQAEAEVALRDRMLRDIIERIALTPERWNGWTTEEVLTDLRARAEKEAERDD